MMIVLLRDSLITPEIIAYDGLLLVIENILSTDSFALYEIFRCHDSFFDNEIIASID